MWTTQQLSIVPSWNWNKFIHFWISILDKTINRTIVELKCVTGYFLLKRIQLSIVPSWNWNVVAFTASVFTKILSIVPSWNWNLQVGQTLRCGGAINRTIVELKFELTYENGELKHAINRTIVELKSSSFAHSPVRHLYQSYHRGIEIAHTPIQSTKANCYQSYHRGIEISFFRLTEVRWRTINRTIVELKCVKLFLVAGLAGLSIVPSWNWNSLPAFSGVTQQIYQSYHRGIEILFNIKLRVARELSIVPSWNWNGIALRLC